MADEYVIAYNASSAPSRTAAVDTLLFKILGRHRSVGRFEKWEWLFLVVSLINIFGCIGLSIARLVVVVKNDPSSPDFTFTILLILNSGFCLFYVFHGLLKELRHEINIFIVGALIVLLYCVIEYALSSDRRTTVKLVRLICVGVLVPVNVGLAAKVSYEFGWLQFIIMGASEAFQNMYKTAMLLISCIRLDLQLAISFVVLVLSEGVSVSTQAIVVLSVGVPLSFIWCTLGIYVVKKELRYGTYLFILIGLIVPVYVVYELIRTYIYIYQNDFKLTSANSLHYTLIVSGNFFLLVRCIVFYELYFVYKNYGGGLRERAFAADADERTGLLSRYG